MFNFHNLTCCAETNIPTVFGEELSYYQKLCKIVTGLNSLNDYGEWSQEQINWLLQEVKQLSNIFYSKAIITPDQFGAKGDGVTDDTKAIQEMFDKVRYGTIVFNSNKSYSVSKEIKIYGGYATLTVLLGSIIYRGALAETPVISLNSVTTGTENFGTGGIKIIGGSINCSDLAGIGFQNKSCYHACVYGLHVTNYNTIGIYVGADELPNISAQMCLDSCYVNNFMKPQAQTCTAIKIKHTDNNINNCITNGSHVGVELMLGGNFFSNCHFTSESSTEVKEDKHIFIKNNPLDAGAVQENSFNGCYFNGSHVKYFIYNVKASSLQTSLNNSDFILARTQEASTSYLSNYYNCVISMNQVGVRKSSNHLVWGLPRLTASAKEIFREVIDYKIMGDLTPMIGDCYSFVNKPTLICSEKTPLIENKYKLFGVIFLYGNAPASCSYDVVINQRQVVELICSNSSVSLKVKNGSFNNLPIEFYIDTTSQIIDNGEFSNRIRKLYAKPKNATLYNPIYVKGNNFGIYNFASVLFGSEPVDATPEPVTQITETPF